MSDGRAALLMVLIASVVLCPPTARYANSRRVLTAHRSLYHRTTQSVDFVLRGSTTQTGNSFPDLSGVHARSDRVGRTRSVFN